MPEKREKIQLIERLKNSKKLGSSEQLEVYGVAVAHTPGDMAAISDELQTPSPNSVSQYIPPAAMHDEQLCRSSIIGSQSKQSTSSKMKEGS